MKKLVVCFLIFLALFNPSIIYALTIDDSYSKTSLRTKEDVISKYKESQIGLNSKYNLYESLPSVDDGVEGVLTSDIQNITLNQINYYRWQYGVGSVYLKSENNYRNQRCAVVLSYLNVLTHYPKKEYKDKLTNFSDKFIDDAEDGCSGGVGYSGNASKGGNLYTSIKEYISEKNNLYSGVGHRFSILDPNAYASSVGFYNSFGAVSMYTSNNSFDYDYLAWPVSGYNLNEVVSPYDPWSIKFNPNKYSITSNTQVYVTYNDITLNVPYIKNEHYNGLSFNLPSSIINKIVGTSLKFIPNTVVNVRVTNLKGLDELTYNVIFIDTNNSNNVIDTSVDFWYKKTDISTYGRSSNIIDGEKYYTFDGNFEYNLKIIVDGYNNKFDISVKDNDIAYYDKNNNILSFYKNGKTSLIVKDKKINKEFYIYLNVLGITSSRIQTISNKETVSNVVNNSNNKINNVVSNVVVKEKLKYDFNNDNVLDILDVKVLLLKIYDNNSEMIYDINNDNVLNILDVKLLNEMIK